MSPPGSDACSSSRKRGCAIVTADQAHQAQRRAGQREPGQPVIATATLTRRFGPSIVALDDLTIAVEPGITGLVGANRAGKSTLIKILLGLLKPSSGTASVLGLDTVTSAEQIRALTGYMPEHDYLPPDMTGTEFVTHIGRM